MPDTTNENKLTTAELTSHMQELHNDWVLADDQKSIAREFKFKGYYKTISFVNVLAWIAQEEKHHPDLEVNFGRVYVKFTTHDVDGLSQLDFNSAKRVDQI